MRFIILFGYLLVSTGATAQPTYTPVKVITTRDSAADVLDVKLLDSKVVTKVDEWGNNENRSVIITIGLEAVASACETFSDVKSFGTQTSIESALPSDYYFTLPTTWKVGCATGSYGEPQLLSFDLEFEVDQRKATEVGKPWSSPKWVANGSIKHLSFYKAMRGGYNVWSLYRLDMTDLNNVKFDFKKDYSYVQGEVQ